jgi:transposase
MEIRYGKEIDKREFGETIGCDTGIKTVASFSHQKNEIDSVNGITYDVAVQRCARKRKGSKNFKQALITRNNILQAILNRINFDNVKQINLEDNSTLKYGKRTNRYLRYHAYGEIKDKIQKIANELGVQVSMQTSHYKSQRCSECGWTQKSNRKGKLFKCNRCGFATDADYNASENNRLKLCWLDFSSINKQKLNIAGFEWLIYVGEEFGVPHSVESDRS